VLVPRVEVELAQAQVEELALDAAKALVLPLPEDSKGRQAAEADPSLERELVRLS
jgi:hypothetical protein